MSVTLLAGLHLQVGLLHPASYAERALVALGQRPRACAHRAHSPADCVFCSDRIGRAVSTGAGAILFNVTASLHCWPAYRKGKVLNTKGTQSEKHSLSASVHRACTVVEGE
jgi:hypothetical protein